MTGPQLFRYVTIAELLAKLGETNDRAARRRLVRRIRARERATGRTLLIQDEPGVAGSALRTTMALARDALPELYERDKVLAEHLARRLDAIEESYLDVRKQNLALRACVKRLSDRVETLEGQPKPAQPGP